MVDALNVLITSAGRRVELLNLFRADAAALGVRLRVFAADLKPDLSAACRVADASFATPAIGDAGYIEHVLGLCVRERVALVVPLQDAELALMAANRERFATAGTRIAVSPPEVVAIARDKLATARAFAAAGMPTPRTAPLEEVLGDPRGWRWPVIAKPTDGAASVGVHVGSDPLALETLARQLDRSRYIVQELYRGREYTVNVFCDRAGRVRCAVPHERLEVRAGEVSKGRTERHPALCAAAQKLADALLGAWGPLCFQAVVDADSRVGIFEINARFGGGYPLAHRAGATFPRWLLEDALGRELTAHDDWRSGVLMLRYDNSIFVDDQTSR